MSDKSLIVPVVLWNDVPKHEVSCILASANPNRYFVTGSKTGQCLTWRVDLTDSSNDLYPVLFQCGTREPVTALGNIIFQWVHSFASLSFDGGIFVWDPSDGRCLLDSPLIADICSTEMATLPSPNFVVVGGQYRRLTIIEAQNEKLCRVLELEGLSDWSVDLHAFKRAFPNDAPADAISDDSIVDVTNNVLQKSYHELIGNIIVVASLSLGGILYQWELYIDNNLSIKFLGDSTPSSQRLSIRNPTTFCVSYDETMLLFASASDFEITRMNGESLYKGTYNGEPYAIPCINFIHDKFVIWESRYEGSVYQVTAENDEINVKTIRRIRTNETAKVAGRMFSARSLIEDDPFLVCATDTADIFLYDFRNLVNEADSDPLAYDGSTSLMQGWPLTGASDDPVSCAILVEDPPFCYSLLQGRRSGQLEACAVPSMKKKILSFEQHSRRVTALFTPRFEMVERPLSILVSGDSGGVVVVWDYLQHTFLHKWSIHVGTVLFFFQLEVEKESSGLRNTFCSVGMDNCIGIFRVNVSNSAANHEFTRLHLLNGHDAEIETIYWKVHEEYLIVKLANKKLFVWEFPEGRLDRVISGEDSNRIVSVCEKEIDDAVTYNNRLTQKYEVRMVPGIARNVGCGSVDLTAVAFDRAEPLVFLLLINIKRVFQWMIVKWKSRPKDTSLLNPVNFLIPWGLLPEKALAEIHDVFPTLERPGQHISYGVRGFNGILSLVVPTAMGEYGRWIRSPFMTSLHMLSTITMCRALHEMWESGKTNASVHVVEYVLKQLPKQVPDFYYPSLPLLLRYWDDRYYYIRNATRDVVYGYIDGLTRVERTEMISKWRLRLGKKVGVMIISILSYRYSEEVDSALMKEVISHLIDLLNSGTKQPEHIVDLFAEGINKGKWINSIENLHGLTRTVLSLKEKVEKNSSMDPYLKFTMAVANANPKYFVSMVTRDFIHNSSSVRVEFGFKLFMDTIYNRQASIIGEMSSVVDGVLTILNPEHEELRTKHLKSSMKLLKMLVVTYPMVDFSDSAQKLAVGSAQGLIYLYDIRTATRSSFKAHDGAVMALSFDIAGGTLASIGRDMKLSTWPIAVSPFQTIFGLIKSRRADILIGSKSFSKIKSGAGVTTVKWISKNKIRIMKGRDTIEEYKM